MVARNAGFSLLELVIAIFLIAVVIGTVLLLMVANLNLMSKANEATIATWLAQYQVEFVRNIEFPPVYSTMTGCYGYRLDPTEYDGYDATSVSYSQADAGLLPEHAAAYTVRRFDRRYDEKGDATNVETQTMYRRVDVYIWKRRGNNRFNRLILRKTIPISRF